MQSTEIVPIASLQDRMMMSARIDVLDKVKKLVLIDKWDALTIQQVADWYGVSRRSIDRLIQKHRPEFDDAGYKVLGSTDAAKISAGLLPDGNAYRRPTSLALLPSRAILLVGMLLTESEVSKTVRKLLLDGFEHAVQMATQPVPAQEVALPDWNDPLAVGIYQMQMVLAERNARQELELRASQIEDRTSVVEAKIAGIEGAHDSFACLGYAKLNGLPTDRKYLARLGQNCSLLCKKKGLKVHKRQDATFGEIGVYPVAIFQEALKIMALKDSK